jgi:SAM-dependent methyltransferase
MASAAIQEGPGGGVRWRAELRPCPCCGAEAHRDLGRRGGQAHREARGLETHVVRCRGCHAVYPRPFLLPEGNPYTEHSVDEYFSLHERGAAREKGRSLARTARGLLGRTGRLLELGCGRGDLLQGAADEGFDVRGVEMTESFVDPALADRVEIAPLERARSLDEPYDVVVLGAVLEHLYEPRNALDRIAAALTPGGVVFVDVPNECGLWFRAGNTYQRLRGRDWSVNLSPTFPPFHVVGFCPRSLRALVTGCGLEVVSLQTPRWSNDLPALLGVGGKIERWGSGAALWLGSLVGMGAGIVCWARKPPIAA